MLNCYSFPCLTSLFIVYLHNTQISWVRDRIPPSGIFLDKSRPLWSCWQGFDEEKLKGRNERHWHTESGCKSPTRHFCFWTELYREKCVMIMVCRGNGWPQWPWFLSSNARWMQNLTKHYQPIHRNDLKVFLVGHLKTQNKPKNIFLKSRCVEPLD